MLLQQTWKDLQCELNPKLIQSLHNHQFINIMPVQKAVIPLMLKNYDLAVEAQTGSGKTLSFLIPLIEKLIKMPLVEQKVYTPIFLLLSPTRELCHQTFDLLESLLKGINQQYIKYIACATGGKSLQQDLIKCQSLIVLVGTIGRLKQIIATKTKLWFKKIDYLYIDEGDRLLKEKGIEQVINILPKMRRTAIFSATMQGITQSQLKLYGMRNLAKISLKSYDQNKSIKKEDSYNIPQSLKNLYIINKSRSEKIYYLINFLLKYHKNKIIVFFNTCASVQYYSKILSNLPMLSHLNIEGIHGQLKHKKRNKIITNFMSSEEGVLLATDVVARGIDFENVNYILQIDPPDDPDNFVHRIGRTARVNRQGNAILFLEEHESTFLEYLKNKEVEMESHKRIKKNLVQDQTIKEEIMKLIVSDRDFIEKAKSAFVSFIRSYKQHQLKYIFQFKKLPIGQIAHSFFLLRLPRIKEILGKHIDNFEQSQIDIQSIPWKNKNQQMQFLEKKKNTVEKNKTKKTEIIKDIKNIKSQRKKVKMQMKARQMQNFRRQQKQIRKQRSMGKGYKMQEQQQFEDDLSQNTQQLEEKIMKKIKR